MRTTVHHSAPSGDFVCILGERTPAIARLAAKVIRKLARKQRRRTKRRVGR